MTLTIHVASYNSHAPTAELSATVNKSSCSIGRASSNDLQLPDKERILSQRHATITFEADGYYLTDNSTNGIYINHSPQPLGHNNRAALHNGDILILGKYECTVSIETQAIPISGHLPGDEMWKPPAHAATGDKKPSLIKAPYPEQGSDSGIAQLIPESGPEFGSEFESGSGPEPGSNPHISTAPLADNSPPPPVEQNYFQPPQASPELIPPELSHCDTTDAIPGVSTEAIQEDWDRLTGLVQKNEVNQPQQIPQTVTPENADNKRAPRLISESDVPTPAKDSVQPALYPPPSDIQPNYQTPAQPASQAVNPAGSKNRGHTPVPAEPAVQKVQTHQGGTTDVDQRAVDAFLSGAGISEMGVDADNMINFMNNAGQLLREFTQGFRQILLTRTSLKDEFRLGMTMLQPASNNAIKFSIDVEDTLTKLLHPPSKGYLPPVDAVHEATDDIQAHQMALLSGLRAALSSLITSFDPDAFEKDMKAVSSIDNLIPSLKKSRYWEQFKTRYTEAAADAENDFLHFMGNEFTLAYEQQIRELKNARPS